MAKAHTAGGYKKAPPPPAKGHKNHVAKPTPAPNGAARGAFRKAGNALAKTVKASGKLPADMKNVGRAARNLERNGGVAKNARQAAVLSAAGGKITVPHGKPTPIPLGDGHSPKPLRKGIGSKTMPGGTPGPTK